MNKRSPILGYNHNFKHRGLVFHVQTEDSGVDNPHIFTHLFNGGTILSSRKLVYDADASEDAVKSLMQAQHKAMMKDVRKGTFDQKIDQFFADNPNLEPSTVAPGAEGTGRIEAIPSDLSGPTEDEAPAQAVDTAAEVSEAIAAVQQPPPPAEEPPAPQAALPAQPQHLPPPVVPAGPGGPEHAQPMGRRRSGGSPRTTQQFNTEALRARQKSIPQDSPPPATPPSRAHVSVPPPVPSSPGPAEAAPPGRSPFESPPPSPHISTPQASSPPPAAASAHMAPSPAPRVEPYDGAANTEKVPRHETEPSIAEASMDHLAAPSASPHMHIRTRKQRERIPPSHQSGEYAIVRRPDQTGSQQLAPPSPQSAGPAGKRARPERSFQSPSTQQGVVVSRPAVIVGAPPTPVGQPPAAQGEGNWQRRREGGGLFGKELVSERSLDEVILQYLSDENADDE